MERKNPIDYMIKVILAEDHNIVRNGIRNLLEQDGSFTIIGEAPNGAEVLNLIARGHVPDLLLADMNMPELGGIEVAGQLKASHPQIKTILLTMLDHEKYVVKAFKAGVSGYLLKNVSSNELVFALKHVHIDGRYVCNELALRFLDHLMNRSDMTENADQDLSVELSKRETEVLTLIAEGYTNQEIADRLFTSKRTIEGYRQSMIEKTGTRNTAALIRFALQNGIVN